MSTFFKWSALLALLCHGTLLTLAQQAYYTSLTTEDCTHEHPENAGYVCESSVSSCDTVAYYRVQAKSQANSFSTLNSISTQLFNQTASAVATASSLSSPNVSVSTGEGLYIPLTCTCYGNHTSQNITYTILPGDTFLKIANSTYEGLDYLPGHTGCESDRRRDQSSDWTECDHAHQVCLPIYTAKEQRNR